MDKIESAVSFAASMIRKGEYIGKAVQVAANYYKVDRDKVQSGLSARSGRSRRGTKPKPKPNKQCLSCGQDAAYKATGHNGYQTTTIGFFCEECRHKPYITAGWDDDCGTVRWTRYTPTKNNEAEILHSAPAADREAPIHQ